jgi:hypothetical protein
MKSGWKSLSHPSSLASLLWVDGAYINQAP